jgi:hypothetical protein
VGIEPSEAATMESRGLNEVEHLAVFCHARFR